jgi:MFS transporter, MFS domain-containing protein family, molybdate-anion transporter
MHPKPDYSVFLWVPALQEASKTFPTTPLPLGYIFSSFMISMMLGSLLYTSICTYSLPSTSTTPQDSSLTLHAKLSSLVCAVSGLALAVSVGSKSEQVRFWAFCAFEACVGMYYPVQGMLRGSLISNEHRATVSNWLYIVFNVSHPPCHASCLHCSASLLTYSLS